MVLAIVAVAVAVQAIVEVFPKSQECPVKLQEHPLMEWTCKVGRCGFRVSKVLI